MSEVIILITSLIGFGVLYFIGRFEGKYEAHNLINEELAIAAGMVRRSDQSEFANTLRKKINAPLVEIPEGFN